MNLKQFVSKHGIKIVSDYADSNPNMPDARYPMNHYRVTLTRRNEDKKRRQMTLYFSMGTGIKGEPTADDVLDCLASDSAGIENARDFDDWCADYGYDSDSRSAERTYKACERQAKRLEKFLGDSLFQVLLFGLDS